MKRAFNRADVQYLMSLPAAVPTGFVLVHNQVRPPTRRLGSRGFRAWLLRQKSRQLKTLEACDCGWAPELGAHFRVRLPPAKP